MQELKQIHLSTVSKHYHRSSCNTIEIRSRCYCGRRKNNNPSGLAVWLLLLKKSKNRYRGLKRKRNKGEWVLMWTYEIKILINKDSN